MTERWEYTEEWARQAAISEKQNSIEQQRQQDGSHSLLSEVEWAVYDTIGRGWGEMTKDGILQNVLDSLIEKGWVEKTHSVKYNKWVYQQIK